MMIWAIIGISSIVVMMFLMYKYKVKNEKLQDCVDDLKEQLKKIALKEAIVMYNEELDITIVIEKRGTKDEGNETEASD